VAELFPRAFTVCEDETMITNIQKSTLSSENFEIDWNGITNETTPDPITASTWTSSPDGLTIVTSTFTDNNTWVQLSGGTPGTSYLVENVVTLSSGQIKVQSLLIAVTQ
jgi:hypothetical protein